MKAFQAFSSAGKFWHHMQKHVLSEKERCVWERALDQDLLVSLRRQEDEGWTEFARWLENEMQAEYSRPRILNLNESEKCSPAVEKTFCILQKSGARLVVDGENILTCFVPTEAATSDNPTEESIRQLKCRYPPGKCEDVYYQNDRGQTIKASNFRYNSERNWSIEKTRKHSPVFVELDKALKELVRLANDVRKDK